MRRTGLALLGVAALGLLWSCAGSSTSRGGDGPTLPVSEGDFVEKVVDTVCGNLGPCCARAGFPYDRAGCVAYGLEEFEINRPPNTIWDSVEAGKCVDWFARVASSCFAVETGDESCENIYRGTLAEGAACESSEECADIRGSEATCYYDGTTPSGRCAPEFQPARGRAGEACLGTCASNDCSFFGSPTDTGYTVCHLQDGLICSYSLGVCVPPPALNEPCYDYYCAVGAYCSYLLLTCQATKPDGESCELDQECTGGRCTDYRCGPQNIASAEVCTGR